MVDQRLKSENVVVAAPMSFTGSSKRVWKMTRSSNVWLRWLVLIPIALMGVLVMWSFVAMWYVCFGLILWPWRLIRRGSRKNKRDALRHAELLEATRRAAQG